ncbi:hypothetical protein BDN70DRAFT_875350 [Pholiota conissans]|uniref:peptidyl-tRNA hydrolase n=1 Tax=Pholiota conissans TaxID=109636 RepID=A0A9P5Z6Y3_9AGAR|nr:hypothetical protein BDN70DRAFT_875350 [Pholiota conissans]
MNISGPSIAATGRAAVNVPSRMIILADSLSHRPMSVSSKFGGSPNGHNGIKSLVSALGDEGFYRLRLGIGRDEGSDAAEYVLGQLSGHERRFWSDEGIDLVLQEIEKIAVKVGKGR